MSTTDTYGLGPVCELDSSRVIRIQPASGQSLPTRELPALVRAALARPAGYPPLASATVPGDSAVLAIEYGVPCPLPIIQGALAALRDAGVESTRITVLLSCGFFQEHSLQETLSKLAAKEGFAVATHDPDDERSGALLGVTKAGRALRLNRLLCDADLVLPIGVCTPELETENPDPQFKGLFPVFSDREAIDRYRAPIAADSKVIRAERRTESDESGWLLGVGLTVQVVPGPSAGVAAVFAGEPAATSTAAARKYREIWFQNTCHRGNLVIATVTHDRSQQNWQSVGRAIEAAERVVDEGGAIAICADLAEPPGPSLRRLVGNKNYSEIERELMRDRFADSCTAVRLGRTLQRGTVYLRSQLSPEIVESLGIAPIATDEELTHLVQTYERCVVLEQANRLLVSVE